MKTREHDALKNVKNIRPRRATRRCLHLLVALILSSALLSGGCFEQEEGEEFYGRVEVPRAQEFRWSDGGMPRVFDPARAEAPPDTDIVRAMFEGLTDYDPRTLEPVAAVASRWEAAEDGRLWTFHLRHDARWSNGDPVTAHDFVRSWRRTLQLGESAPHLNLLQNIEGVELPAGPKEIHAREINVREEVAGVERSGETGEAAGDMSQGQAASPTPTPASPVATPATTPVTIPVTTPAVAPFGVKAVDDFTLTVRLRSPDKNFPALVAHPVFRPVHELGAHTDADTPAGEAAGVGARAETSLITNGAFRLAERGADGVLLERHEDYWDAASVALERVRVAAKCDAEEVLAAYRAGEVYAVTNAAFEPLALKLLAPYKDFRRQTFGALTYYVINTARAPFNDQRVREALALALDAERLSQDTMGGATVPAARFNPLEAVKDKTEDAARGDEVRRLKHDPARARRLLAEAGFPGGTNFPLIRLLVNRNEQQRLLAHAVKTMWAGVLGVRTEVIVRGWDDYEATLRAGDYDIARRSVVMQTTGEETLMLSLFGRAERPSEIFEGPESAAATAEEPTPSPTDAPASDGGDSGGAGGPQTTSPTLTSEAEALRELPAIPIYFPSSFSLVKPYVSGFDTNPLDVPSLKRVRIETNWKPPTRGDKALVVVGK